MTKEQALYNFFNQFDMVVYEDTNVPDTPTYPYITYRVVLGSLEDIEPISTVVNVWYNTENDELLDEKVEEISYMIGYGGTTVKCDEGIIWIKRGSPFSEVLKDNADGNVKRRCLNIMLEFITTN